MIADDTNTLLVSTVSIYEIGLKAKRKRVDLPPQELRVAFSCNVVEELAITMPPISNGHRDLWDRLPAAQTRDGEPHPSYLSTRFFDGIDIDRRWCPSSTYRIPRDMSASGIPGLPHQTPCWTSA